MVAIAVVIVRVAADASGAVEQLKASAAAGTSGPAQALNDDLLGFNLVVGEIVSCEQHPDPESSKLLVSRVDCGEPEPRSVCSGIAAHYANPQDLVGKKVVIVGNLKARNMKGVKSHGMCLCASNEDKSKIEVVEAPEGSKPRANDSPFPVSPATKCPTFTAKTKS